MFLFINGKTFSHTGLVIFKYISCSYLSGKENYGRGYVSDLNTSHVLIYLYSTGMSLSNGIFKYISCSYLSFFLGGFGPPTRI